MPDHAEPADLDPAGAAQAAEPAGPIAVYLDRRTCAGQRTCTATAPMVFRYSAGQGHSEVITEVVDDPAIIARVRDAEDLCPTQSIHVTG